MKDIQWKTDCEETDEKIEEVALAEYNNYSLGLCATLYTTRFFGEVEAFVTEKNLATGKDKVRYARSIEVPGFSDFIEAKMKRITGNQKRILERIARGEEV